MSNKLLDTFLFKFFTFLAFVAFLTSSIHGVQASVPKVDTESTQTGTLQVVETLVNLGPRTPESSAIDLARHYLSNAYEQAGYVTETQPFYYQNLQPLASSLAINASRLKGNAALGSPIDCVTAPLVPVMGRGDRNDFISAGVGNAIAVIYRSDIPVAAQVDNAFLAGAVGLAVVNSDEGNWTISLTRGSTIPVLALSSEQGEQLFHESSLVGQKATLDIQPLLRTNVGHNLIARSNKAIFPRLVIGAHYDSVWNSVGANDNASGTAVVLELARNLVDEPLSQWIWFVAFDAEERSVAGSRALAASLPRPLRLRGMLNIEMVGLNNEFLVTGSPELLDIATAAVPAVSVSPDLGLSDHYPFQDQDIPVLVLTRGLHENKDTPLDTEVNEELLDEALEISEKIIRELLPAMVQ